jgi:hypothetical protein
LKGFVLRCRSSFAFPVAIAAFGGALMAEDEDDLIERVLALRGRFSRLDKSFHVSKAALDTQLQQDVRWFAGVRLLTTGALLLPRRHS